MVELMVRIFVFVPDEDVYECIHEYANVGRTDTLDHHQYEVIHKSGNSETQ